MTARSWSEGDPEPSDHPSIVDSEGVTWNWGEDDDDPGRMCWIQRKVSARGIFVFGGLLGYEWADILAEFGPVREATEDEARNVVFAVEASRQP